ncbi:MAG: response regulator [Leptospira sp.]|nr:response regulator [Leptospira sp.]
MEKTKSSLASYIEQLETTNNAILRSNEDLNFASTRYQSLNEQLEASNEELRVSNEELHNAYAEVSTLNKQLKSNQQELSRKEATLRAMVDNVPGVIFSAIFQNNSDFHFTYISPKVESIFGIDIHLAYEKGRHAFPVHPEDKEEWKASLIKSMETVSPWNHNARLLFEDGRIVHWEAHASVMKREDGSIIFDGVLLNTTQEKEQEQIANKIREEFRNTVNNVIAVVYKLKRLEDGEYEYVFNDGFIGESLGITTEKVVGHTLKEICGEEEAIKLRKEYDQAFFGSAVETEFTFRDRWYFSRIVPYFEDGKTIGITGSAIDITEKKQLETRFLQSQKMETIGYLAGGIAHDLNNMLQPIFIYSKILKDEWKERNQEEKSLDKIDKILASVERAKKLVVQILDFSRNNSNPNDKKENLPLKKSIEDNLNLLLLDIPCNISKKIDLRIATETYFHMDPVKFTQVLMNLINNAIHSMENRENSFIEIIGYPVNDLPSDWNAKLKTKHNSGHIIEIRDTGIGIDSEKMKQIFDPFFTGKPSGEGLGLGLSIVYGIMENSEGSIEVISKLNEGTTFRLFFPTFNENIEKNSSEKVIETSKAIGFTGEVLLVDDDEFTKESIQDLLEIKSIPFRTFDEATQGIEYFKENSSEISLIITDYKMPKMTGVEFVEKIRNLNKEVPIILYTGNTLPISDKFLQDNQVTLLEKPLDVNFLLKNIENLRKK